MDEKNPGIRINKYMSDAGICSRREADRLVESGQVLVDGVTAVVGTRVLTGQKVVVKGKTAFDETKEAAISKEAKVLLAYNKPKGVECTADRSNPDNIIDKIGFDKRVYTVGRLDKNSCGLILLTNDGELANQIAKAGEFHEKEYLVRVDKPVTEDFLKKMAAGGVPVLDKLTAPCKIVQLDEQLFRIVLIQGLNRQIRRMCEYFGYRVVYLKRVRVMNILLGKLETGAYREVTPKEKAELKRLLQRQSNYTKEKKIQK